MCGWSEQMEIFSKECGNNDKSIQTMGSSRQSFQTLSPLFSCLLSRAPRLMMMTFAYAIKKKISLSIQLLNGLVVQGG